MNQKQKYLIFFQKPNEYAKISINLFQMDLHKLDAYLLTYYIQTYNNLFASKLKCPQAALNRFMKFYFMVTIQLENQRKYIRELIDNIEQLLEIWTEETERLEWFELMIEVPSNHIQIIQNRDQNTQIINLIKLINNSILQSNLKRIKNIDQYQERKKQINFIFTKIQINIEEILEEFERELDNNKLSIIFTF